MNSTMTITPDCNIDYNAMQMRNKMQFSTRTFQHTEHINIYDLKDSKEKTIRVIDVSLYTNLLILDGERYKILHMLSK